MHASIEQLLTLRDAPEPVDPAGEGVATHVAGCADCGAELARLQSLHDEMQRLPERSPPGDPWQTIRARACERAARGSTPARVIPWWPVSLAASVTIVALVALLWPASQPQAPVQVAYEQPATSSATRDLVAESRRLEQLLRSVSHQPRVVNAGTADTIAQLEDRIALLDYGLSVGAGTRLTADDANALWQQRVDLMNSLVQVRTAQAQRVDF